MTRIGTNQSLRLEVLATDIAGLPAQHDPIQIHIGNPAILAFRPDTGETSRGTLQAVGKPGKTRITASSSGARLIKYIRVVPV